MPVAGQTVAVTRSDLNGGISDIPEWEVELDTNGDGYATALDNYNLISSGHYTAPDPDVEGDTGTYNFAYPFTVPEDAEIGDVFKLRFTGAAVWNNSIVRLTGEYLVTGGTVATAINNSLAISMAMSI